MCDPSVIADWQEAEYLDRQTIAELKAEIARITAQRDRLREAIRYEFGEDDGWTESHASLNLQPGDMTD
jgi:hypothetical protein